jgi:phage N-6-adenine-methyltransferase
VNKETTKVMFSSKTGNWATPQAFFDRLNKQFGGFTLDPCADSTNAKCHTFFTASDNGLDQDWTGHNVFVNPPYGRGIDKWIQKGFKEAQGKNTKVVMLIPARTDTKYWHEYVMKAKEIYLVKGRLKFGASNNAAPFPSAVVVFDGSHDYVRELRPKFFSMERA